MAAFWLQNLDNLFTCVGTTDASAINYQILEKATFSNNEVFLSNKCGDESSSVVKNYKVVESREQVTHRKMEKKRVHGDGSSFISLSRSMDDNEVKSKRQKKSNGVKTKDKNNEGNDKKDRKDKKEISDEAAPTQYVHVRARRGQATDSHSLAERVRREKIRERMKILQGLVPGCDKITGKALMLDEIINYVHSLQNQAEFLSRKLASLNPTFFEFGADTDHFMITHEAEILNVQPPIFSDTFTGLTTPVDNYPLLDHTGPSLLFDPQIQKQDILFQDNDQALWDVIFDDEGQKLHNEFGFMANNLSSFH